MPTARRSLAGMEAGYVALYQKCVHLGCRVPWCRARSGSSARATARSTTGSVRRQGGPAPRGLDRFVLEVSGGNIIVDNRQPGARAAHRHEHHRPEPGRPALCLTLTDRRSRAWRPDRHEFPHRPGTRQRRRRRRHPGFHHVPRRAAQARTRRSRAREPRAASSTTTCSRAHLERVLGVALDRAHRRGASGFSPTSSGSPSGRRPTASGFKDRIGRRGATLFANNQSRVRQHQVAPVRELPRRRRWWRRRDTSWSRARIPAATRTPPRPTRRRPYCLPQQVAWAAPSLQLAPLRYSRAGN